MILGYLLGLWIIITIISAFVSTRFFLCSYLSYFLIVPFMDLRFMGIPLGYNAVVFFCLIGFILHNKLSWKDLDFKPLAPFLTLYLLELAIIPFQDGYPMSEIFNSWRVSFMGTLIAPFIIWNGYKKCPEIYSSLKITFLVCICVVCGYALFLTTMPGINPYLIMIEPLSGVEFNEGYALAENGGRMFGRISSVYLHPMTFGLVAIVMLMYLLYIRDSVKWKMAYPIIILVGLAILFCGVRSAIGGVAIGIGVYLLLSRKIKLALTISCMFFGLFMIAQNVPGINEYLTSITDTVQGKESSDVVGSTMEMRMDQLNGALNIISDCPIQGKGFGWTAWYHQKFGDHPICFAFESLIYVIIVNQGLLGFIFWGIMLYMLVVKVRYKSGQQRIMVFSIVTTYIAYSMITGEYGYMAYMLIPYMLILMDPDPNKELAKNKKFQGAKKENILKKSKKLYPPS